MILSTFVGTNAISSSFYTLSLDYLVQISIILKIHVVINRINIYAWFLVCTTTHNFPKYLIQKQNFQLLKETMLYLAQKRKKIAIDFSISKLKIRIAEKKRNVNLPS